MKQIPGLWRQLGYVLIIGATAFAPIHAQAESPAPKKAQAKFEIKWMTGMIDHHHMAVMMGELCVDRAVHPELVAMCEEMVSAQMAEIEQMQGWLLDWYGVVYEPQMKPRDERMIARMADMEGEEFEMAFMEMMIRHHSQAIREGRVALRRTYHPELRDLAANIIETQSVEIVIMREWLCDWYGRCIGRMQQGQAIRFSKPEAQQSTPA
jgi:uncharacterized protein (DUF305 family)